MPEGVVAAGRINGWDRIARYVGCDVTTAIRRAKAGNLPVHQPSGRRGAVHAYRHELDAWLTGSYCSNHAAKEYGSAQTQQILRISSRVLENGSIALAAVHPVETSPESQLRRWNRWYLVGVVLSVIVLAVFAYRFVQIRLSSSSMQLAEPKQLTSNGLEKYGLQTDGRQLYFGQYQNGWLALASMSINGGPIQILWHPAMNVMPVAISPDRRTLLAINNIHLGQENEVWVVPLNGDQPHRLGSLTAHALAYAPDGKTIALANRQSIYLTNADGSSPREIRTFAGLPDTLHWSTDGTELHFALLDPISQKPSWWKFVLGTRSVAPSLHSVPSPEVLNSDSRWYSPAAMNDAYFFVDHGIWIVQYGRGWRQSAVQVSQLSTDIDGSRGLAFDKTSDRLFVTSDGHDHNGIEEFDPRTHEFRYILPGVTGDYPDYSRDKQWIAWAARTDSGGAALWVARADGSIKKKLASFKDDLELPRWSPDGLQIAFMGKEPSSPYRIYIVGRDGGEPREASEGSDNQGAPTWSPDGRFVTYGSVLCIESNTCAIHTIDLETRKIRTLAGSEGLMTARWSPNGQYIAALRPELHQLLLFDVNEQRWRKLADSIDSADLGWSADSQFLYVALPGENARIARISAETGKAQTVFELKKLNTFDLTTVHDYVFGVTPDNDLLFSTPNPATEIYSWQVQDR